MPAFICVTCGTQQRESAQAPSHCLICEDERQWVRHEGQAWTTLDDLQAEHKNALTTLEPNLTEIHTVPDFAIGQRALLVQTPRGNILWDCVSLIDGETIEAVKALGGIDGLAMSHPHMYGSMVTWSHAFGDAPIWLHSSFEHWVTRPDPVIEYWEGDRHELDQGINLLRCGGHFSGSTVLHWPAGAEGLGVLLSSDTLYVAPDRKRGRVTFMYSYPNFIPLSAATIDQIVAAVAPLEFDRIYSHFPGLVIEQDAKSAIDRSVERYKRAIES